MPKQESNLNKHEKIILLVLAKYQGPLSIKKVAELSGMSWVTAKKYLEKLHAEGKIRRGVK